MFFTIHKEYLINSFVATKRNLDKEVTTWRFWQDIFYRSRTASEFNTGIAMFYNKLKEY